MSCVPGNEQLSWLVELECAKLSGGTHCGRCKDATKFRPGKFVDIDQLWSRVEAP